MTATGGGKKLMNLEESQKEIERLQRELEAARIAQAHIYCKVGEKGGLSVYGLGGRFPLTLYAGQWRGIIENIEMIKKALADNASKLKEKE